MGVLDAVVNEVGSQFGLSTGAAGSVLSGLLSLINQQEGGLSGFLDRFRRAGVGNLVTSWLSGDAKAISADTVESAIGHDAIDRIASKSGVPFSATVSAIAFMLPKLIQRLAPGGAIPARLPADITSYITGPTAALASGARQAAYAAETMARPAGLGRYLWPLLALLIAAGLLVYWLTGRSTTVSNVAFNIEEQVRDASQRAMNALGALKPGFTATELTSALNLQVINFATGSAQVPADSTEFLNKAATALKSAPAGTVIEVGGHTDNTGDAGANLQLSQQRADAVRGYLVQQGVGPTMLVAKGYGDTKPVASNDTEEGRFRNRRIEFNTVR